MRYLENYLERIKRKGNLTLADAISKTVSDVVPQYISNFSFREHVVSLLVGDVQSGKTSHMFGLMCAAADEGFVNFILLTTDNILLQQQTFKRAEADLCDFCICDENDYLKFVQNNMRKPAVIVLKKNGRILKQWKNNLSSTNFVAGNPLFIIDDEADAASLNTKVNKNAQSTINKNLEEIKKTTTSSIYMEVTGTPQSILLQTIRSGWKPYFIYYFRPGKGYLGGNFFFPPEVPPYIVLTDNDEATDILNDEEFPENGLKTALVTHLLTSAHIMLSGGSVCNFLIHPSMKTDQHTGFAEKIGEYLNEIIYSYDEEVTRGYFKSIYDGLKLTKHDMIDFSKAYKYIIDQMKNDKISILVLNSFSSYEENAQYESGINILVGGNSLGRGVTFPQLQTIYYCRVAKSPQADTMWQHAKVFKGFINSMLAENSSEQGKIIVRRDRDISKGTGTLLSPNDRKLGDQYDDEVVLTLYKVTGNKGWDGQKIWIPNIKLPGNRVYYSGNDIPEQDNKLCYDILVNTAKVAESTIPYDHNNK